MGSLAHSPAAADERFVPFIRKGRPESSVASPVATWALKVFDAYRPVRAAEALVAWARAQGRGDLSGRDIASVCYHNSGQAVDLTLVDRATNRELDRGTGYETFTPAAHTANAAGVAAENRAVLWRPCTPRASRTTRGGGGTSTTTSQGPP